MIARSSWYALGAALLLYFSLSPLLLRPLAVELGFYSLAFTALLIAVKFFKHNWLSLAVKVAAYFPPSPIFSAPARVRPPHGMHRTPASG